MNKNKNVKPGKNQNELVLAYITKPRNKFRKLTTEQICIGANTLANLPSKKSLTPTQVSMCLNRLSNKNLVKKYDHDGRTTTGRKCTRWAYNVS